MKPTKLLLGFAALTAMLGLAWLGEPAPALARPPTVLYAARHPRALPLAPGTFVGAPRAVQMEAALLAELNARRSDHLLPPLAVDGALVTIARERSADMVERDYFSHVTPDGVDVYAVLDLRGVAARLAGENLARNNWADSNSPAHASAGFMASQPHRLNVLNSRFTRAGIGVAIGGGGMKIYTVLFAGD